MRRYSLPLPDARPCLVAAPPSPSPTLALWGRPSPHLPAHRRRRATMTATLRRAAAGQVRRVPSAREDAPCAWHPSGRRPGAPPTAAHALLKLLPEPCAVGLIDMVHRFMCGQIIYSVSSLPSRGSCSESIAQHIPLVAFFTSRLCIGIYLKSCCLQSANMLNVCSLTYMLVFDMFSPPLCCVILIWQL